MEIIYITIMVVCLTHNMFYLMRYRNWKSKIEIEEEILAKIFIFYDTDNGKYNPYKSGLDK